MFVRQTYMNLVFNFQTLGTFYEYCYVRNNFKIFEILMNFIKIHSLNTHKK